MSNSITIDGKLYSLGDLHLTLASAPTATQPPITQVPLPALADYGLFKFDPKAYPLTLPPGAAGNTLPSWSYAKPATTPILPPQAFPTAQAGALQVGPTRQFKTITTAVNALIGTGERIEVDPGTYSEAFHIPAGHDGLTIAGIGGRPVIDVTGMATLPWGNQAAIVSSSAVTLDRLEIMGASTSDNGSAAFRPDAGISSTVKNCYLHHSQNGMLTNGGNHILMDTEVAFNGWDGQAHNLYFSGAVQSVQIIRCYIHDAVSDGQNVKTRALNTAVYNSIVRMMITGSRAFDISDAGNFLAVNCVVSEEGNCNSREIVGYGAESGKNGGTSCVFQSCTFTVGPQDPSYIHNYGNVPAVTVALNGCVFNDFFAPTLQGAVTIS